MARWRAALYAGVVLVGAGCGRGTIDGETLDTPLELDDETLGPMVIVRAGTFSMGSDEGSDWHQSDEAAHEVTLTHDFLLGRFEITQAVYQRVTGDSPSEFSGCPECPVENLRWHDAAMFANRISAIGGLEFCYDCNGTSCTTGVEPYGCEGYRLPTEAEWEYAARAGTTADFTTGSELYEEDNHCYDPLVLEDGQELGDYAWYCANARETQPVGQLAPNPWSLHDMGGNVWEWCHDWYWTYDGPATDPIGPVEGGTRALRGGSWDSEPLKLRVANRSGESPWNRKGTVGLRLARTAP